MVTGSIKMKYFCFFAFISLSSLFCIGQKVSFEDCSQFKMVFFKAERDPQFKFGKDSLKRFFQANLTQLGLEKATGKFQLDIIIDSVSNPFLCSYINETGNKINDAALKNLIKQTAWKPGFQNGYFITFDLILSYYIRNGVIE